MEAKTLQKLIVFQRKNIFRPEEPDRTSCYAEWLDNVENMVHFQFKKVVQKGVCLVNI